MVHNIRKKLNMENTLLDHSYFLDHFHRIHPVKTVSYGNLLAYIAVSVQSDLILPELQHLFQQSAIDCIPAVHCG